jgi:hypothetical protein
MIPTARKLVPSRDIRAISASLLGRGGHAHGIAIGRAEIYLRELSSRTTWMGAAGLLLPLKVDPMNVP